jgi:hypothetical protein
MPHANPVPLPFQTLSTTTSSDMCDIRGNHHPQASPTRSPNDKSDFADQLITPILLTAEKCYFLIFIFGLGGRRPPAPPPLCRTRRSAHRSRRAAGPPKREGKVPEFFGESDATRLRAPLRSERKPRLHLLTRVRKGETPPPAQPPLSREKRLSGPQTHWAS